MSSTLCYWTYYFALKLFDDDDDEYGIGLGTLREISILRLLRAENAHPNIVEIHDVQTAFGEDVEEWPVFSFGAIATNCRVATCCRTGDCKQKLAASKSLVPFVENPHRFSHKFVSSSRHTANGSSSILGCY